MANLTKFGVPVGGTTTPVLMPKLQYRFRVTFNNIGGPGDSKSLTHQIVSVTRPTLTHEEITLDVYNSKIFLAGKHSWEAITLVIRDDVDNKVIELVDAQMQNQIDHHEQSAPLAGAQYKFTTIIDTLDGRNDDSTGPDVLDTWTLGGCWISSAAFNESNYATSDAMQINLTIRYDNAKHENDVGVNLLSGQSIDTSLLGATANSN
jgi:hypothetical protein